MGSFITTGQNYPTGRTGDNIVDEPSLSIQQHTIGIRIIQETT